MPEGNVRAGSPLLEAIRKVGTSSSLERREARKFRLGSRIRTAPLFECIRALFSDIEGNSIMVGKKCILIRTQSSGIRQKLPRQNSEGNWQRILGGLQV